jgi:outer membrane protein TolC
MKKLFMVLIVFSATRLVQGQQNQLALSFSQVIEQFEKIGFEAEWIRSNYELAVVEGKSALAWSNPDLGLNHEQVRSGGMVQEETIIQMNKKLSLPWVAWTNRRYWGKRLNAEAFRKEARLSRLLARKKNGYVQLSVLKEKIENLELLEQGIRHLIQSAQSRETQGMLSEQDRQLIELSLLSVTKMIIQNKNRQRSELGEWKNEMGIAPEQEVVLTTPVRLKAVDLGPLKDPRPLVMKNPGLQQRLLIRDAGQALVNLEQSNIIPDISLNVGYKKMDEDFKGYVAGFSLPLPVFNLNRSKIQEAKLSKHLADIELDRYRQQTENEMRNLLKSMEEMESPFQHYMNRDVDFQALIAGLEMSYREGWLSAIDFLNAVQIAGNGVDAYFEFVSDYYQTVFELEVLTGIQLVDSF